MRAEVLQISKPQPEYVPQPKEQRLEKKEQLMKEGLEAAYADDYASALAKVAKARATPFDLAGSACRSSRIC